MAVGFAVGLAVGLAVANAVRLERRFMCVYTPKEPERGKCVFVDGKTGNANATPPISCGTEFPSRGRGLAGRRGGHRES